MSRDWVDVRIVTYNIHRSRGLDRRTRPERIAAVLAAIEPDIVALQEVIGPGPQRARATPKTSARRSAWAGSWRRRASTGATSSATSSSAASRSASTRSCDLSWKTCEPRNSQRASIDLGTTAAAAVSTTCTSARRCSSAATRRRGSPPGCTTAACTDPRSSLGDFNEWGRGLVTDVLAERLQSVDLFPHLQAPPHLPGLLSAAAPRSHLLRGRHRGAARRAAALAPRARRLRSPAARRRPPRRAAYRNRACEGRCPTGWGPDRYRSVALTSAIASDITMPSRPPQRGSEEVLDDSRTARVEHHFRLAGVPLGAGSAVAARHSGSSSSAPRRTSR